MKTLFIKSFGCQMNAYDAARMADAMAPEGYVETDAVEDADLIVLNTCNIREKATEKVYSELGRMRRLKTERAADGLDTTIVVAGCVAQAEGREILRRAPVVDAVVGPQSIHRLPALLRGGGGGRAAIETDFAPEDKFASLPAASRERTRQRGVSAFLTVQEGCDKFCTFCVVPYTRGAEISRPIAAIRAEAERLVEAGVREIALIGQNVNAYHGIDADGSPAGLARLLYALAEIPGLARLRYTTSHPRDMDDALIAAHRDLPPLMPYLHLPVQAGSDRVLAAMNRRHTADEYRRVIDRVRAARPDIALSSDFIVGFPGETDADFAETLRLARDIRFASAFSFKYSPRPGTPAADMSAQVPMAIKAERLARLQAVLDADRHEFDQVSIDRTMDVLIEKPGRDPGQLGGKTPYLQAVFVPDDGARIGDVVPVRIVGTLTNCLVGEVAGARRPLTRAA